MYFFTVGSCNDPASQKKVAILQLNEDQQIYFENKMKQCIDNLIVKYNVEFNTQGIYVTMDYKSCEKSLASKKEYDQIVESDLNEIDAKLKHIAKHSVPDVSALDNELLNLVNPGTDIKISDTFLEANNLLYHEGFLYGEKSSYDNFVEGISQTVNYMKKDSSICIENIDKQIQEYLEGFNTQIKPYG